MSAKAKTIAASGSPWPDADARARDRAVKRTAVLEAAVRSFNDKGFAATSLDNVATALGISKPTIYHYFADKDEILFECVRRGLAEIRDAAEGAEARGGSGASRLHALLRDYGRVMTQPWGMCVTRTADAELSETSREKFRALKREIDATIRSTIEDGIADGSLAEMQPRAMAFAAAGALNWIGRWYDPDGSLSGEEASAAIVDVLFQGVLPRAPE